MSGVQLSEVCGQGRDRLDDVGHGWERVYGPHDELVEFCVIRHQTYPLAITFRHKEGRRAPICGLGARDDHARSDMLGDFRIDRLLETQGNGPGR